MIKATAEGKAGEAAGPAAKRAAKTAAAPSAAKKKAAAAPAAPVDETVDKHRKALAEALEQAEAIDYDSPPHRKPAKADKAPKADKSVKARKLKLVRDRFAMPEAEYAQIGELKKRLGGAYKKSELLRAGVAVLCALNDAELLAVMAHIKRVKNARPAKKG